MVEEVQGAEGRRAAAAAAGAARSRARAAAAAAAAAEGGAEHRSGCWTTRRDRRRAPCASGRLSFFLFRDWITRAFRQLGQVLKCHLPLRTSSAGDGTVEYSMYGWRCRNWRAWRTSAQRRKETGCKPSLFYFPPSKSAEGTIQYHPISPISTQYHQYQILKIPITCNWSPKPNYM